MTNILTHLPALQAGRYTDQEAFRENTSGQWVSTSWSDFNINVGLAAKAIAALGINEHDNIAIFSPNRSEILTTDFGAYLNRAVPISIYATSTADQVSYILRDASVTLLFVGTAAQYAVSLEAAKSAPSLRRIVVYDNEVATVDSNVETISFSRFLELGHEAGSDITDIVAHRTSSAVESAPATIIYTSGPTGEPKGCL